MSSKDQKDHSSSGKEHRDKHKSGEKHDKKKSHDKKSKDATARHLKFVSKWGGATSTFKDSTQMTGDDGSKHFDETMKMLKEVERSKEKEFLLEEGLRDLISSVLESQFLIDSFHKKCSELLQVILLFALEGLEISEEGACGLLVTIFSHKFFIEVFYDGISPDVETPTKNGSTRALLTQSKRIKTLSRLAEALSTFNEKKGYDILHAHLRTPHKKLSTIAALLEVVVMMCGYLNTGSSNILQFIREANSQLLETCSIVQPSDSSQYLKIKKGIKSLIELLPNEAIEFTQELWQFSIVTKLASDFPSLVPILLVKHPEKSCSVVQLDLSKHQLVGDAKKEFSNLTQLELDEISFRSVSNGQCTRLLDDSLSVNAFSTFESFNVAYQIPVGWKRKYVQVLVTQNRPDPSFVPFFVYIRKKDLNGRHLHETTIPSSFSLTFKSNREKFNYLIHAISCVNGNTTTTLIHNNSDPIFQNAEKGSSVIIRVDWSETTEAISLQQNEILNSRYSFARTEILGIIQDTNKNYERISQHLSQCSIISQRADPSESSKHGKDNSDQDGEGKPSHYRKSSHKKSSKKHVRDDDDDESGDDKKEMDTDESKSITNDDSSTNPSASLQEKEKDKEKEKEKSKLKDKEYKEKEKSSNKSPRSVSPSTSENGTHHESSIAGGSKNKKNTMLSEKQTAIATLELFRKYLASIVSLINSFDMELAQHGMVLVNQCSKDTSLRDTLTAQTVVPKLIKNLRSPHEQLRSLSSRALTWYGHDTFFYQKPLFERYESFDQVSTVSPSHLNHVSSEVLQFLYQVNALRTVDMEFIRHATPDEMYWFLPLIFQALRKSRISKEGEYATSTLRTTIHILLEKLESMSYMRQFALWLKMSNLIEENEFDLEWAIGARFENTLNFFKSLSSLMPLNIEAGKSYSNLDIMDPMHDASGHNQIVSTVNIKKIFTSKARPCLIELVPADLKSPSKRVIFKKGDDLRQDLLVQACFYLFNVLWKHSDLQDKPIIHQYRLIPMGPDIGCVEFVQNCESLNTFDFTKTWPKYTEEDKSILLRSAAGSYVAGWIMGVRDRHQDNMMMQHANTFFHIDLGHIFNEKPTIDAPRFAIPPDLKEVMTLDDWERFKSLCADGFRVLHRHAGLLTNLICLLFEGVADLKKIRQFLSSPQSLMISLDEEEACEKIRNLIESGVSSLWRVNKWGIHSIFQKAGDKAQEAKDKLLAERQQQALLLTSGGNGNSPSDTSAAASSSPSSSSASVSNSTSGLSLSNTGDGKEGNQDVAHPGNSSSPAPRISITERPSSDFGQTKSAQ